MKRAIVLVGHIEPPNTSHSSTSATTTPTATAGRKDDDDSSGEFVYKYFDIRARGECVRLVFAAVQQSFIDHRYSVDMKAFPPQKFKQDRRDHPEKFPFGLLPTLEVDGTVIAQSHAIERFLARRFDLIGSDDVEAALVDSVDGACHDLFEQFLVGQFSRGEKREKAFDRYYSKILPTFCKRIDRYIGSYGSGYVIGNRLSLADIAVYYFGLSVGDESKINDVLQKFPQLYQLKKTVESVTGIKKWLQVRPNNPF